MASEKGDTIRRELCCCPSSLLGKRFQAPVQERETQASPPGLPELGRCRWELLKAQAARPERSAQSRHSGGLHTNQLLHVKKLAEAREGATGKGAARAIPGAHTGLG